MPSERVVTGLSEAQLPERSKPTSENSSSQISEDILIKKQMSEIDKQINRRMQNKNIRKVSVIFPVLIFKLLYVPFFFFFFQ